MTQRLRTHGEILRLARVLDADPAELTFLEAIGPDSLHQLTEQVTGVLFDTDGDRLRGVRAAATLLPAPVAASIGERAMGPVLGALLVGAVDDDRLVDIASRLSVPFLAEVSRRIDPRRAAAVAAALAPEAVAAVAAELVRQGEGATLGHFVGSLSDASVDAVVPELDGTAVLVAAAVSESPTRTEAMVAGLEEDQRVEVLQTARASGWWLELLALTDALGETQRARVADLAVETEEPVMADLIGAAEDLELWPLVLPLLGSVSAPQRKKLTRLAIIRRRETLIAIVQTAAAEDRWTDVFTIAPHLPKPARRHLAQALRALEPEALDRAILAANTSGLNDDLIALLGLLDEDDRDVVMTAAWQRTTERGTWADLLPLVALLPPSTQERLAAQVEAFSEGDLAAFLRSVDATELWQPGLQVLARLAATTPGRLIDPVGLLSRMSRRGLAEQIDVLGLRDRLAPLNDLLTRLEDGADPTEEPVPSEDHEP